MAKIKNNYINQNQDLFTVLELQLKETREQVIINAGNLGECFEKLFNSVEKLKQYQEKTDDSNAEIISEEFTVVQNAIGECIMALQSSDAICQRIEHSYKTVSSIKEVVIDSSKTNSEDSWETLKRKIRESYSIQKEREIFDSVINVDSDMYQEGNSGGC